VYQLRNEFVFAILLLLLQELNALFSEIYAVYQHFIGQPHFDALMELLRYKDVAVLLKELTESVRNLVCYFMNISSFSANLESLSYRIKLIIALIYFCRFYFFTFLCHSLLIESLKTASDSWCSCFVWHFVTIIPFVFCMMRLMCADKFHPFTLPSWFVERHAKAMYIAAIRIHIARLLYTVNLAADAVGAVEDNPPCHIASSQTC